MDYSSSPYSDYKYRSDPRWFARLISDSTVEPVGTSDIRRQVNLPTTFIDDDQWISSSIVAIAEHQIASFTCSCGFMAWSFFCILFCPSLPLAFPR